MSYASAADVARAIGCIWPVGLGVAALVLARRYEPGGTRRLVALAGVLLVLLGAARWLAAGAASTAVPSGDGAWFGRDLPGPDLFVWLAPPLVMDVLGLGAGAALLAAIAGRRPARDGQLPRG